jgi:hypothetical protein
LENWYISKNFFISVTSLSVDFARSTCHAALRDPKDVLSRPWPSAIRKSIKTIGLLAKIEPSTDLVTCKVNLHTKPLPTSSACHLKVDRGSARNLCLDSVAPFGLIYTGSICCTQFLAQGRSRPQQQPESPRHPTAARER